MRKKKHFEGAKNLSVNTWEHLFSFLWANEPVFQILPFITWILQLDLMISAMSILAQFSIQPLHTFKYIHIVDYDDGWNADIIQMSGRRSCLIMHPFLIQRT